MSWELYIQDKSSLSQYKVIMFKHSSTTHPRGQFTRLPKLLDPMIHMRAVYISYCYALIPPTSGVYWPFKLIFTDHYSVHPPFKIRGGCNVNCKTECTNVKKVLDLLYYAAKTRIEYFWMKLFICQLIQNQYHIKIAKGEEIQI